MLPRIQSIVALEPFTIICRWTTGEIRQIDFKRLLEETPQLFNKIKDEHVFKLVQVDPISKTLFWDNLAQVKDYDGLYKPAPLDFCPDTLYENSTLLSS